MADQYKARDQLISRALKSLGIIEPNEAPSIEDYTTVNDMVDPLLAQLMTDQIVYIGDSEEIPLEYFEPLARLLANNCGPDFGSPINQEAKARDEALLRRLSSARPTYEVLKTEYF